VLVAPLDWGLGHATRCIPIVRELLNAGCEVIIAAEGKQKLLLQEAFPSVTFLQLAGYHVTYSSISKLTMLKLILQIPRILSSIRLEHQWLKEKIGLHNIDLVISDNRYGLYSIKVPSIFITHQLLIKTSLGYIADRLLQYLNYRFIKRFSVCWVPDYKDAPCLAGDLSHPSQLPATPLEYIGPITRFHKYQKDAEEKHLLFLLSGPEPQRSILEILILKQLESIQEPVILVRGLPGETADIRSTNSFLKIYNHLPSEELVKIIIHAAVVVCRSGYSSVMDLIPAGCRCAFIPTPGQPEQVYLAKYLSSKRICLAYDQQSFSIEKLKADLIHFAPQMPAFPGDMYKAVIRKTLHQPAGAD
jgi:uncharacterized protein (TIGR00661 family)